MTKLCFAENKFHLTKMLILVNIISVKAQPLILEKELSSIRARDLLTCLPSASKSGATTSLNLDPEDEIIDLKFARGPIQICAKTGGIDLMLKEVNSEWIRRLGTADRSIPQENVETLLGGDMHLYFSPAQIGAMLECAKHIGEKRGSHLHDGHHYYNFTSPIKRSRGSTRNLGKALDRNGTEKKKRPRKMSKRNVGRDVFLGGSCNPTTWRKDVAIPLLEDLGITYYNPQVAEWTEDLVTVEHNAKESATVLFYFLDRGTRNVVSIVELAHFAGSQRGVVLVTDPYKEGEIVAGEHISHTEYEELCCGLSTLHDLVIRQGISVHGNITEAIKWIAKILNNTSSPQRNQILNNTSSPQRKTSLKLKYGVPDDSLKKPKEVLNKSGKGDINVCLAYYLSSNKTITDLNGIASKAGTTEGLKKNVEQICATVNDMKTQNGSVDMNGFRSRDVIPNYDLYIGGSCFDYDWKENIALPILRNSSLKFVFAECGQVKNSRACASEAGAMENSNVLLFVITNKTRGLETMALASYYIGCQKNVVLCIQNLTENTVIGTDQLSKIAVKDYNRGRVYLSDLASRSGVPVFEQINEAVEAAVSRCKTTKGSTR